MNKKRKAQIKFGETFGIIIIVFLVLMVGSIWYNNYMTKEVNEVKKKQEIDKAFEKYYFIVNSHLLHKSSNGDIDEQYTTTNINTFYEYSQTDGKEFVRKQLGNSLITVELVNSEFDSQSNLTIYNNTPKSFIRKENYKTLIPVINDTNKNKAYIGILKITVFN